MNRKYILTLIILIFSLSEVYAKPQKYWIFFKDKGRYELFKKSYYEDIKKSFPEKTIKRRAKMRDSNNIIDETDLPISKEYKIELERKGIKIVSESKWLNGVTAFLNENDIRFVSSLKFVESIKPVYKLYPPPYEKSYKTFFKRQPSGVFNLDYGPSFEQNNIVNVPKVHNIGINGKGIIIGMMDAGANYKTHEAFQKLKVLYEYDFVNNDRNVSNETGDPSGHDSHGTKTLAIAGGYKEGQLIGPAFGSEFVLAKTEYIPTETHIEEDNWAKAVEWMDSIGVDIISSSLGYREFDSNTYSYTYSDMNGKTTIVTKASEIAYSKGIVVVNSMGNEGNNSQCITGTLTAPADGFHVISVGSVTSAGLLSGFSSTGPTSDGRIKPDIVAQGSNVYTVTVDKSGNYIKDYTASGSGTSFSCPMVAGISALILSAHPELTPDSVISAIRNTANRNVPQNSCVTIWPNNFYGWGIADAYKAILYFGTVFSNLPTIEWTDDSKTSLSISIFVASLKGIKNNSVKIFYKTTTETSFKEVIMTKGSIDDKYVSNISMQKGVTLEIYFSAEDSTGKIKTHPYNAPDSVLYLKLNDVVEVITNRRSVKSFILYQNYPNPWYGNKSGGTTIRFTSNFRKNYSLDIFDVTGRLVKKFEGNSYIGLNEILWDGRDINGKRVSSGIYFYRLKTRDFREIKRIVYIK
jgi:hypothetical protein